jgi:ribosome-associated protein
VNPGKNQTANIDALVDSEQLPSKSQLKRDAKALKSLASQLLAISDSKLKKVPLESDLMESVLEARSMRSHGARKRQLQYVAKLLRRLDPVDIIAAIEGLNSENRALTARQHRSEAWREILLEQGDPALNALLQQRPDIDIQKVRQLIRNSRAENSKGKPPASARVLFRILRDLDTEQALPPCP